MSLAELQVFQMQKMKFLSRAGVTADLDPPGTNPLADMDPPSQIWNPLPNFPFKHPLYHIWYLILFASFFVDVLFNHNTTFPQ